MVGVKGDPFYISMECGAREAADAAGVSLDVQGPDRFDVILQNPMLDAVAAAAPDALLVAPNDRTASAGPLANMQEAGTVVVLVDTIVDDPTIGVSRIATDNFLGGVKAAEALDVLGLEAGDKVLVHLDQPWRLLGRRARRRFQREGRRARVCAGRGHAVLEQRGLRGRPDHQRAAAG